ncbi:Nif3-like dinuclear metal center hexameric protein [Bathymodiolus platifrons methanotrophic gill symbiont]|uniref:Nif3-like dinuclear metal center hexameric protein n=1 Tax=Bathymodiolus platifrons methanotrophic gill symbiont TaxID=113268 RepID=UPI0030B846E3
MLALPWRSPTDRSLCQTHSPLVQHNINLFAYHLPLDAHPEVGNAAVLGQLIDQWHSLK